MRLTGLRGVGKTVLLHEFSDEATTKHNWVTVFDEVEARHNNDQGIAELVTAMAEKATASISRAERVKKAVGKAANAAGSKLKVDWKDVSISLDFGQADAGIAKTLLDACKLAVEKTKRGVLLLLDEAQSVRDDKNRDGQHPLSLLISAVVALQKQEVPIGLVLCGLPTLTGNLLKAKSYTERMFRGELIGSLEPSEARNAFVEPLRGEGSMRADDALVERVIRAVEGYPYFVQLWGAELWDAAFEGGTDRITTKLLDATQPHIYHRLDHDFYEPRIDTLTPAEQDLLLSTVSSRTYPPLLVAEIIGTSRKSAGNTNVLLGRLVEAGVLYRVRQGQYDYTAPKFRQYLNRRAKRVGP
jgi:hypothetical protein